MSELLKKALAGAIRINMISDGRRKNGTYVQFIINEELIPVQLTEEGWIDDCDVILRDIKKRWNVQYVQIRERHENSKGKSRTVSIIHNLVPFEFMRQIMGIIPKASYYLSGPLEGESNRYMLVSNSVEKGRFSFCDGARKLSKSNPDAREAFASDLAHWITCVKVGGILEKNRQLVMKKLCAMYEYDEERNVAYTTSFLRSCYVERIGEALCLDDLPWEEITITEEFLNM